MTSAESKRAFFRQGSWMMTATVLNGACMFLVHPLAKAIPAGEYTVFVTMLQLLSWLAIPATGLQMVFAQLTASAIDDTHQRALTGAVRAVLATGLGLWLVFAAGLVVFQGRLIEVWQLQSGGILWLTLFAGLMALWSPALLGVLQGRQNFLWMGWVTILNGIGRVALSSLFVFLVWPTATGIMLGALLALLPPLLISAWQARGILLGPSTRFFAWRHWLARLAPLSLGFGSSVFVMTADVVLMNNWFDREELAPYSAGSTLAKALVTFTIPLAHVMFPKIVHSIARNVRSNAMTLTMVGTLVLGSIAVLGLGFVSPVVLRLMKPEFASIAPLMFLFGFCMLPLALANVLIHNLMARSVFAASPVLALVAVGYGVALHFNHDTFRDVIQTLGVFSTLLMAVALFFTWRLDRRVTGAMKTVRED